MKRAHWTLLLQITVSVLFMGLLLRRIPLHESAAAMAHVRPQTVVLAIVLSLIGYWGRSYRWSTLLARAGVHIPAVRSYCITLDRKSVV